MSFKYQISILRAHTPAESLECKEGSLQGEESIKAKVQWAVSILVQGTKRSKIRSRELTGQREKVEVGLCIESQRCLLGMRTMQRLQFVGHGGALVESMPFDQRGVGSNPTLAAM